MGLFKKKETKPEEPVFTSLIELNAKKCIHCAACFDECIMTAIQMDENMLPVINNAECIGCGICVDVCPNDALSKNGF